MDETEIKHVVEAALLAAGRPLTLERLGELFAAKGGGPDRATLKRILDTLAGDYQGRGIELKEVATGYRVQIKGAMSDWLQPLWEERAPRYTRALLETLALVAYRQPITRAEIEEVRGVVVSTNIVRTLLERNWIRVVGHRDVPGKPAMFGTTKEFLDYFGLKKLEELPTLAEIKDGLPELSPQADLIESLARRTRTASRPCSSEATNRGRSLVDRHRGGHRPSRKPTTRTTRTTTPSSPARTWSATIRTMTPRAPTAMPPRMRTTLSPVSGRDPAARSRRRAVARSRAGGRAGANPQGSRQCGHRLAALHRALGSGGANHRRRSRRQGRRATAGARTVCFDGKPIRLTAAKLARADQQLSRVLQAWRDARWQRGEGGARTYRGRSTAAGST